MSVLRFSEPARAGEVRCSRAWRGPRRLRRPVLLLCLTAAIGSFAATSSAWASCPVPQGTHFQGTYETENSMGTPVGSGTFDSISKEFVELVPGEFRFNASTEYVGKYFSFPLKATGTITGGLLKCVSGVGIEEIPLEEQSGTINGSPFSATDHALGTFTATEISGTSENNFGEKARYSGVFDPNAGSAGIEPGNVEVISPAGTVASEFSVTPATGSQLPAGTVAPAGALAFSVSGVPAGGTIDVTLVLPPGSTPTAVYKPVGGGVYEEYPASKTQLLGNLIVLELTDNESPWDEDPTPGVIGDPAVPVQPTAGGMTP